MIPDLPNESTICNYDSFTLAALETLYPSHEDHFKVSPYPSLIAANYLAAIGAVDTGVVVLEDWIKNFGRIHNKIRGNYGPQLEWYLLRAKLSAVNLWYQFGGFTVPHPNLVTWQGEVSNKLGELIKVTDADGWKRLCTKPFTSSIHETIRQWLAYTYATERFYLFENLLPEDFEYNGHPVLKSLQDLIREAQTIRDFHACIDSHPFFSVSREKFKSYFALYTAQLRLFQLADERNTDRRKTLIDKISEELQGVDRFGTAETHSLLPGGDVWERHRVRLRLVKGQLEDEKNR
jgi:hypothetical protein